MTCSWYFQLDQYHFSCLILTVGCYKLKRVIVATVNHNKTQQKTNIDADLSARASAHVVFV